MATNQVTPHPSQPQPYPKPDLYAAIAALNRDLGVVIDDLNRLRDFRLGRNGIDALVTKIEYLRARANAEFLERLLSRELKDNFHFWRLDCKFEDQYKDPNDVLIDAQRRRERMTIEERDAVAFARESRKRRRRAEKLLQRNT
jgi:hypothetical protein